MDKDEQIEFLEKLLVIKEETIEALEKLLNETLRR